MSFPAQIILRVYPPPAGISILKNESIYLHWSSCAYLLHIRNDIVIYSSGYPTDRSQFNPSEHAFSTETL